MNRILTYLTIWVLGFTNTQAQEVFYQDVIQGGVIGTNYSPGVGGGVFTGFFNISTIPNGSQIKRAFLFAGRHGQCDDLPILFNGDFYVFSSMNQVSESFESVMYGGASGVHVVEVSNSVNLSTTNYEISTTQQQPHSANKFSDFYLLIIYENPLLSEVSVSITINNTDFSSSINYTLSDLNPIETSNDVSFALYTGYICDDTNDGTSVFVNGANIGVIGGADIGSGYCGGPAGSFSYENGVVTGLNDDIANSLVNGSDALANVQSYITNLTTFFSTSFSTITPNNRTNAVWSVVLTYTTSCTSFPTALTVSDTTICEGEPLQLGASGGINYDWLPQTGLSCYDCPNPAFTADSSTVYTVRIWSTDSCSKVLPVHVKVNPKPKFESIQITPSGCGKSTGSIVAMMDTAQAPYQYTLDNQAPQPDSAFTGLASGNYALSVENVHGCTNDTLLAVHEELSVTASFTVNPVTGSAPLWVQTENTSTNATDYLWEWSGGTTTDEHPGFTLDTAGNYTLTLIAYDGAPHCSDTFSLQVLVYDSLQVSIPNVFTPNQDGRNDFFGITTNVSVSGKVSLFNRWGNPMRELEFTTQPQVFEPLWDGTDATEGVYFYQLELTSDTETYSYSGFVQLVK